MKDKRFNFTKAALDALEPTSKLTFYYDAGGRASVRGLAIAVHPTGAKTFYLYRKVKGKPKQIKIGPFPDLSIENARKEAERHNGKIAQDQDPVRTARKLKGEMTFAQLFAWYLEEHSRPRKKTWEQDEWRFNQYLGGLASRRISDVKKADLRKLHAELGEKHGIYTANKVLIMVQGIYNQAMYHDLWEGVNPALGIRKFKEQSRDRRLTAGEVPAFFAALESEPNEDLRDYIRLSLYTGARRGNVTAMRWDEIDFAAGTWRIPETKNGLPQVVPLEAPELEVLRRRLRTAGEVPLEREMKDAEVEALRARLVKDEKPWVFPSTGTKGHLVEPKKGWASFCERAGLGHYEGEPPKFKPNFRIHDLRRTLGSWMVDTGATLAVIGSALNHQNQATTAIYARLSLDPVRAAKGRALEALLKASEAE